MIYGYARVSRRTQKLQRQIDNILTYAPGAKIYAESFTGRTMLRPKWKALGRVLKEGDTIVFDSVSRMARTSEEGIEAYFELHDKGIKLVFLKEHHIDTETYDRSRREIGLTGTSADPIIEGVNKFLAILAKEQIKIAFDQSEKEVSDLRQRTREGIRVAKEHGKIPGHRPGTKRFVKRKADILSEIYAHNRSFGNGTLNDSETARLCKICRNTLYKYKRELIEGVELSEYVQNFKKCKIKKPSHT